MNIDRVRKELQESALREFPNPERVGCPDAETLAGMSRRIIQMTQDQLHHVTHCSPCFQTFLAIRQEMRQGESSGFGSRPLRVPPSLSSAPLFTGPASSDQLPPSKLPASPLRPLSTFDR